MLKNAKFVIKINADNDIIDITEQVKAAIRKNGLDNALVAIHSPFSYSAVKIMEYNPGLVKDFSCFLEKIFPNNKKYEHNIQWQDDFANGYLKSSLLGNSAVVPFINNEFELDRFQRILLLDFSGKQGARSVIIQMVY